MNCNAQKFSWNDFPWKTYRFFFAIFEGKIQGIFYCKGWGDGHLWSGRNGLKVHWKNAVRPILGKEIVHLPKNNTCSGAMLLCLCHVCHLSFWGGLKLLHALVLGHLPCRCLEDTSDDCQGGGVATPSLGPNQCPEIRLLWKTKMDPWCCITKTQKSMQKMDSMDSIQFLIQFWQWFGVLIHEKMDSMIGFNS